MVYAPLAVPAGTVKVYEPELAIPAVDKMLVPCSSRRGQRIEVRTSKHSSFVQIV